MFFTFMLQAGGKLLYQCLKIHTVLIRLSGLIANRKTRTTRNECCIFLPKIPYIHLSDFIVSSRLLFVIFWTLKLSRIMTYLQMEREMGWMVCHILLFILFFKLISIMFNRWFYWWYTCRKWVGDPTTCVAEYPAEQ